MPRKTDYDAELDDIRAQLYQQQITIDELQARISILNQENETIKDELYNITSGVDVVGLYSNSSAKHSENCGQYSWDRRSIHTTCQSIQM